MSFMLRISNSSVFLICAVIGFGSLHVTPYSLKWENRKILRVLDKQVMPHSVVVETYKGSQHIGNHNNPHF